VLSLITPACLFGVSPCHPLRASRHSVEEAILGG
jgi:hypothetical protein